MLVVGLTGGIGSGKSTVGKIFSKLGIAVIDADEVSRQVMNPDGKAYQALRLWLGSDYFDQDGYLNRKRLRSLVFNDSVKRKRLETIVHPKIGEEFAAQLSALEKNHSYCIIEIPLLNQGHKDHLVQRVIVVDCSPETQLVRSAKRDSASIEEIKQIMAAQMSRQDRLALADDIINNDKDLGALEQQVQDLHQHYMELAVKHTE